MITKEQKIQEAYGSYWAEVKLIVDENGWFDMAYSDHVSNFDTLWNYCDRKSTKIRPKSLSGIDNNNGWTKIETDDDLPKFENRIIYNLIINNNIECEGIYNNLLKSFCQIGTSIVIPYVTHYQPIQKPKPPIY